MERRAGGGERNQKHRVEDSEREGEREKTSQARRKCGRKSEINSLTLDPYNKNSPRKSER